MLNRLKAGINPYVRDTVRKCYRKAQVLHNWAMEIHEILLPALLTATEVFTVFAFFTSIRFNFTLGPLMPLVILPVGIICFFLLKVCFECGARLRDASRDISKLPYLVPTTRLMKTETVFLRSCKPITIVVGSTVTVTRNTFLTVSQDIVLMGLINLLLTF